jgi:hypothetical protein
VVSSRYFFQIEVIEERREALVWQPPVFETVEVLDNRLSRGAVAFCPAGTIKLSPGPKAGPVSKLGNTFVSELGDTPVGKNPLGVSERGQQFFGVRNG